jgi:Tfp pilus assembly PilM family ATPase
VPFEEAEKIKLAYGIGSSVKDDPIFHAVKPTLENLVAEMGRSIEFYLSGLKYSPTVDRIVVCGGGANTKGFLPYLSKRLGKEVELGDPWVNFGLGKDLPIIERQRSVQFSTAIGLALRGLQYEDRS